MCEKGNWCINSEKSICESGKYENYTGLSARSCSGLCPAGYECLEGSIQPIKCDNNYYSSIGLESCIECSIGNTMPGEMLCQDSDSSWYNRN